MVNVAKLILLVGKSEQDDQVKCMLSELGIATPLKRPKKGDDEINFVLGDESIELSFKVSEAIPSISENYSEGELILYAVFARPASGKNESQMVLPHGLNMAVDRASVRAKLGKPEWSSPMMNNDRWVIDGLKTLVCFEENEASIREIVFSIK